MLLTLTRMSFSVKGKNTSEIISKDARKSLLLYIYQWLLTSFYGKCRRKRTFSVHSTNSAYHNKYRFVKKIWILNSSNRSNKIKEIIYMKTTQFVFQCR